MSTNQKQPATGGPQTRYSSSPYQPILPQHPTNYTGPDSFHNQGAPYVNQGQGPNQGPGLRSLQPTGPPNQSSTPPNQDLKVAGIPGQIPQMQYVAGQVRAAPGQFFQARGTGGPHAQQRMPNQQHRAQGPAQMYPQQYQVIQPLFIQNPPIYYNSSRQPNNIMPQQPYQTQVYPQTLAYPAFPPPVAAAGPSAYSSISYQPLAYQPTGGTMTMARPTGNPAVAAASNAPAGNLATQAVINQQGPMHNSYSRNTNKQKRRPNAVSIIDPKTGEDKLDEIFDSASHPTSGDSSARQTPQPAPINHHKEIQAAFAKQVAQAIDEDRRSGSVEPANVLPEPPTEQFHPQPVNTQSLVNTRFDIQNSNLQYDAKEFVSIAFIPSVIEPTPIVSANSEAVEVILTKKDRESPVKSRKQAPREPKPDPPKEIQPKDISDCDKSSSIVKEEIVSVPQITVANTQPAVAEPIPLEAKEPAIEVAAEKKPAKKPAPVEPKSSEPEVQPPLAAAEAVPSGNGKSKNFRNKHVQNGKSHPAPAQPAAPVQVPVPQPPKSNNRSSKTKDINLKGANKEGTDMDAFNDNKPKTEVNANVVLQNDTEKVAVASNTFTKSVDPIVDLVNANPIQQTGPPKVVPKPVETDTGSFPHIPAGKDANENDTTIKAEAIDIDNTPLSSTAAVTATAPATATATAPPLATAPVTAPPTAPVSTKAVNKRFDVTSIIKDDPKPAIIFPIVDNRDEADKGAISKTNSLKNDVKSILDKIIYKAGQWAPNRPDGKKVYDRDFLWSLKNLPASNIKPEELPDYILSDVGTRQMDSRLSMAGRSDHMPSFNNYVGKSGSQRGAVSKRGSQSGKMGSRGGDKPSGKPQPKVSISLRGDVKLHESENAWKPTRLNKGDCEDKEQKKTDALLKKFRSVLNKLTPQRFSTLVMQVGQLQIDTKERLEGVINLMFDKAIDEPNFANSYAMMCKEIQNMQVNESDKSLVFRGLLVNRCQQEFEKQSIDETVRNMKVKEIEESTDPEKKKELEIELEEYDRRLRMKSVGTIRFIGELFKQQMLTVKIVRRCLESLLVNKDEESLECLCKLLSTIGKELEKSCPLNDIFEEMKRITDGKRQVISSRIRFMLQDVIDLRDSKWIPRRGDTVPKTIDQIQKEAETEQLNIQAMNNSNPPPRKDDRGGNMRGSGNSRSKQSSDEGWSSVPQKNNRPFSIQSSKMRAPKLTADERLGSSQMFGAFVKGAGSSKNSQSVLNHGSNMYNALQNADMQDGRSLQPRGKDPYSSKGPSMERNTYKGVYEGRGSRSGSQHRDNIPMWGMAPPQPAPASMPPPVSQVVVQPPPPPAAPAPVAQISEEQLERKVRATLDEFITVCCTSEEFFQDISPHVLPKDLHNVVYQCYNYVLEKSQTSRLKTGELFATLISSGNLSVEDFIKGFVELLELWEDLVIDMPQIWQYFAEDIVSLILGEVMTIQALRNLLAGLVEINVAKNLLKPLFALVVKEKGPNFLQTIFLQSGLQLSDFMPASDVEPFVQQNNLDFLVGGGAPVGQSLLSSDALKKKLSEFFQRKAPFDDIVNWISANVGDRVKDFEFTRALAGAIFEDSIPKNKLQPEVLTSHSKLLQKYVDNDTAYELQCLYVLQSLVHKLEHPSGLLLSICDKLYEDSTFCQESFIAWEKSTDPAEQEGKGVALKQLTSFFTRLKENEEDDDSSSHSEDA